MDRRGRFAAFSGQRCGDWRGHLIRPTYSLAGNILVGPQVLETMASTYEAESRRNLRAG